MAIKKRALYEIALKNEEILDNKEPKSRGSYDHIYTKIMYQRCFAAMYSVNNDIVAPMTVLHEYLVQYRKETDERKARERTAPEIYARCCRKAELDLQRNESLELGTPSTRELVLSLQTVLYVTGELGGPNSNELLVIVDNLFAHLLETLPPELSFQLKRTMDELEPYRKRMNNLFKIVPKEEASEDVQ
ncbi:hypothetical protein KR054_012560 [Drosophila jambulina]|nr:hypothetical protein KR054_012560 [Drosophila jambulina]